jgi:hypothetical protein
MYCKVDTMELPGSSSGEARSAQAKSPTPSFRIGLHTSFSQEGKKDDPNQRLTLQGASGAAPNEEQTKPQAKPIENVPMVARRNGAAGEAPDYPETLAFEAIRRFSTYLREERERYRPQGRSLTENERALFGPFFPQEVLDQVRVVALCGQRIENPHFYLEAMMLGLTHLPDMTHKASATFLDVIVFNEPVTSRAMFHALVHAAQVHVLGERFFSELFAREVLRVRSYSLVPMKAQAFALDVRFAAHPERAFSVEAEIRAWLDEGRY